MFSTHLERFINILKIARLCHQVNKAYCEGIGDQSQKDWEDAEQWQRDSAVKGVEYALANPEATPESQHDAWKKDKLAGGWVYGEAKDAEKKTHHCIVPYDQLPQAQRVKDLLFQAVVRSSAR